MAIDDSADDVELLRVTLNGSNPPFELEREGRLAAGLARAARGGFDALVLDLTLPDSRGIDTVARARGAVPDLPIVLLTGLDNEAFGVQAVQVGAQDYLVKDRLESRSATRTIRYAIERRRAERASEAAAVAQERETLQRDLVANVSHELRTPIVVIKSFAEALRRGALDDPRNRLKFIRTIERHADRLGSLVEDLLTLSALDSGSSRPSPEPVELAPLAWQLARDLTPVARRKGVAIRIAIPAGVRARVDPRHLSQILMNLLDNAIKHNQRGGTARLEAVAGTSETLMSVTDDGPGICADELPHLFKRFRRSAHTQASGIRGTGLGLSIAKTLTEANGGRVGVKSSEGRGTAFHVHLPAA